MFGYGNLQIALLFIVSSTIPVGTNTKECNKKACGNKEKHAPNDLHKNEIEFLKQEFPGKCYRCDMGDAVSLYFTNSPKFEEVKEQTKWRLVEIDLRSGPTLEKLRGFLDAIVKQLKEQEKGFRRYGCFLNSTSVEAACFLEGRRPRGSSVYEWHDGDEVLIISKSP